MKYVILAVLLMSAAVEPAAAQLPEALQEALSPEAKDLLEAAGEDAAGVPALLPGLTLLWERGTGLLLSCLRENIGGAVLLLIAVLLCALVQDCLQAAQKEEHGSGALLVGGLCIAMITAGDLKSLMGLGIRTVEELEVFSGILLPALSAAVAAGGGVVSAGMRHVAAAFFSDVLISVIRDTLIPLVYVYVTATVADLLLPGRQLHRIARCISKVTVWLLSGILAVYTGYLMLSGTAAGAADTLTVRATKAAMGTVPVVGRIISDAAGTVLTGAAALKNTVGIAGMLAVLAMCLSPFVRLAAQYLAYRLAAFLAGMVGPPRLVELIEALGSAFGLILGMTGACALMIMISLMSCVMAVSP